MTMLNSIVPSVNPWVTPTGTGLQLDIFPLFITLRAQQFSQFLIYFSVHLSSPCFMSLSVKMLWEAVLKTLLKIYIKYFYCLYLTTKKIITSQKAARLVRHGFRFINPCWLFPATFFSFTSLELVSKISFSFPEINGFHGHKIIKSLLLTPAAQTVECSGSTHS